jgi:lysylphosphatidylglycerol synthetase-like protein (DUF2156 family)
MTTMTEPTRPSNAGSSSTHDLATAAEVLKRHASNPSAFLALNSRTEHFSVPGIDGLVAYRRAGRRHLVQLGGVFADPASQDALLQEFLAFARRERRRVVAVQLMREDAERYAAAGFTVNQLGADYSRSLATFSLAGKKHMQLRNKISRARRAGVTVVELPADDSLPAGLRAQLSAIDAAWLRAKGRHVKELDFMVGERGGPAASMRRLLVALDGDGKVLAHISFSPVYGERSGWLHDLSRRSPDAPPGALELVVVTAVEKFTQEGASYLHFGFTPFTSLDEEHELPRHSGLASRIVRLLAERGSAIYPAADQLAYKEKWGPDLVQPEYVAFQGRVSLGAVWSLLRLTNAA